MVDRWMRAGGSDLLDSLLYDSGTAEDAFTSSVEPRSPWPGSLSTPQSRGPAESNPAS